MIHQDFEQIDNWLRQHAEKIAVHSLQPPATEAALEKLETAIGKPLPTDFKKLYQWHNGLSDTENFGSLFFGMDFFSIDRIITEYGGQRDAASDIIPLKKADMEIEASNLFNPSWIQFAFDGSHTGLYLDLAPAAAGQIGQIIFIDTEYDTGICVASSTAGLVADFAKYLRNGLYHLAEDALEDDNHYLEADDTIDIVNWQTSERWRR
ncbi:SMI1/KNR4 family protein [Niabella beijingensis]|uniref:SMI1/KNR4 family protein n=1 Tax=Niabella beijingensis TaxID=2872700 RepID=UPI001CBB4DE3|nr:SMI1/KNR4 family protein [Niabella beijingensis]MBZ4188117.1 SMI1/KNR4 family protein [Niabella beijingensis]